MDKFVKSQWGVFAGHHPQDPEREAAVIGSQTGLHYKQTRQERKIKLNVLQAYTMTYFTDIGNNTALVDDIAVE